MSSEAIQVLLVEDNLADARLLYEGLEEALPGRFQMTHVRRLDEALEHLWKETCHVVLLDLGLPDSHGIDTLTLTRAQAPKVPIVVLTGFHDEQIGDQALEEGAQDYLVKGQVDSKRLARALRYAISRKTVADALIGQECANAKARVLKRSRQRLIAAHERVRRDIASQLYSGIQNRNFAIENHLRELLDGIGASPTKSQLLESAISGLDQKIADQVSVICRDLYPTTLEQGLVPTFRAFANRFAPMLPVTIDIDEDLVEDTRHEPDFVPEKVLLAAYRIAEEALVNVVKHSGATKAVLRLESGADGYLRLTVTDNGHGFDTEKRSTGLGIGTMQDYAESVDGNCWVQSDQSEGTEVTAVLPILGPEATQIPPSPTGAK